MESVLQKFQAMKEERMRFAYETQSKNSILLSNKFLKTCNCGKEKRINIEEISKQIIQIQNFISGKDSYRKHFEYYTSSFFQYFNDKFKELFSSNDFDTQINDIIMLLDSTEELIDEHINSNSNRLNQIKENCCVLDLLLQVDYQIEQEELDKLKLYSSKVKTDSCDQRFRNAHFSDEKNKILKLMMKCAKIVVIREHNSITKSVNYDANYHCNTSNSCNYNEWNYDMNIYFNRKESRLTIKKCLSYIKKHMIMKYVIIYNKAPDNDSSNNINANDLKQFIHYKIYGIGKSFSLFRHYLSYLIKTKVTCDSLIKCSLYSSIEYLHSKNLFKASSNRSIIHHNFNDDCIRHYQQQQE